MRRPGAAAALLLAVACLAQRGEVGGRRVDWGPGTRPRPRPPSHPSPRHQAYAVRRARSILQAAPAGNATALPPRAAAALGTYLDNTALVRSQKRGGWRCGLARRGGTLPTPSFSSSLQAAALHALPAHCAHLHPVVTSIGKSVNGADIWAVALGGEGVGGGGASRASHLPSSSLPKPAVKYVAGLHGDEPSGRQLLLALAEWVCAQSAAPGGDARAAALVGRAVLHLLPAANPDGFAAKSRANAAGVDLNRDFPDPLERRGGVPVGAAGAPPRAAAGLAADPDADDADLAPGGGEQPETAALMAWTLGHRFVASAALHEVRREREEGDGAAAHPSRQPPATNPPPPSSLQGAIVANYPWDGTPDGATRYAACPDDATFKWLATSYASRSRAMLASREFARQGGVTNGAQWYPLRGGMQDWNYLHAGCFELTLELSDAKWPPVAALPGVFADNLDALLAFPLLATAGARGRVVGAGGGPPPLGAAVRVRGVRGGPPIRPDPATGAFWRPLAPGEHTLAASAPGHKTVNASVSVTGGPDGGAAVVLTLAAEGGAEPVVTAATERRGGFPARRPLPRRSGPPHLPAAPASTTLASERTMFVAQGAAAFASAGCLGLMARAASRRAAAA